MTKIGVRRTSRHSLMMKEGIQVTRLGRGLSNSFLTSSLVNGCHVLANHDHFDCFEVLLWFYQFNFFRKVPKEFARELVSVLFGRGEDFCLCNRQFCYSIDFGELFWSHWFCVVIRFFRHESVACIDFGVGSNSVLVQHRPVPYTRHFYLPPFLQSLRCDLRVSWTQEASPRRKGRMAVNQVWQDRVILIIQVSDFVLGVYESLRSDLNWARFIFL